jgi:predicted  nucleic acid-binding Zn-ribbon protein
MDTLEAAVSADIDLSQLLTFNVGFNNLQLLLKTMLTRLDRVEQNHAAHVADTDRGFADAKCRDENLGEKMDDLAKQLDKLTRDVNEGLERLDDCKADKSALMRLQQTVDTKADSGALQRSEKAIQDALEALATIKQRQQQHEDTINAILSDLGSLRSHLDNAAREGKTSPPPPPPPTPPPPIVQARDFSGDIEELKKKDADLLARIAALEGRTPVVANAPAATGNEELEDLKKTIGDLRNRVSAAPSTVSVVSGPTTDYGPAIKQLQGAMDNVKNEIKALGNECTRNTAECQRLDDKKADKDDIPRGPAATPRSVEAPATVTNAAASPASSLDLWKALQEIGKKVEALQRGLRDVEADAKLLHETKANKADVDNIAALLRDLQNTISGLGETLADHKSVDQPAESETEKTELDAVQKQVVDLIETTARNHDWTKGQVLEIRATIEHIHHSKADASLVANKAERDYVENSMEKLMREVEQVLNATNAGLIDTLDKSLNILRDMIDGKATKADVNRLQSMIGEEQLSSVPEGLMGFKGYRCLGCNRTLEGMRQRPMGTNFSAFVNRTPVGTRQVASSQGARVTAPAPPAGYIPGAPNVPGSR